MLFKQPILLDFYVTYVYNCLLTQIKELFMSQLEKNSRVAASREATLERYDKEQRELQTRFIETNHDYKPRNIIDVQIYEFMKVYALYLLEDKETADDDFLDTFLDGLGYPQDSVDTEDLFCRDWMLLTLLEFDASKVHEMSDTIQKYSKLPSQVKRRRKCQ